MKLIVAVLIFCLVLFLYIHIFYHLKTSNDLDVYEIEQPSKDKLEEICNLRQPVFFEYENVNLLDNCIKDNISKSYGAFDVNIRKLGEESLENELYVPVTFNVMNKLLTTDKDSQYITEKNSDFLEESGLMKIFRHNDMFLRPHMVSNCLYDYIRGSNNTTTPLKYELNNRNYFYVTEGAVGVMLIPPKNSKYLYTIKDYENFEFRSPVNPWDVQDQYKADFNKIKSLEMIVKKGNIVFIPPFWWYSIKFTDSNTSICSFKYRTYMNTIAITPQICMSFLQQQNTKREIVKKKNNVKPDDECDLNNKID